jgi:hypothetical protein
MAQAVTEPVGDSVPKINNEIAVGSDLEFQRKWWKFEKFVWAFFTLLLILNVCGFFGRGPFAKAHRITHDGSLEVSYERLERYGTPSVLRIQFSPVAIRNGKVQLWVSESLVKALGNQRVSPEPDTSAIGHGGILYTFAATTLPATVQFSLQPATVGSTRVAFQVPGFERFSADIFVFP